MQLFAVEGVPLFGSELECNREATNAWNHLVVIGRAPCRDHPALRLQHPLMQALTMEVKDGSQEGSG